MAKWWTKEEVKAAYDMREGGMTYIEISKQLGRSKESVGGMFDRLKDKTPDEYCKKGQTKKETYDVDRFVPVDPREACLAHWYDLAAHHPSGWGSYRIDSEFRSQVRGYVASHVSLVGSSAAVCAGA